MPAVCLCIPVQEAIAALMIAECLAVYVLAPAAVHRPFLAPLAGAHEFEVWLLTASHLPVKIPPLCSNIIILNNIMKKGRIMKRLLLLAVMILGFSGLVQADVIGNKDSKFFFPADCSFAKMIKKDNVVTFKSAADAVAAGYKASSKCKVADDAAAAVPVVGNKSSKLFFPTDCSVVKTIKDDNKVSFKSAADAVAAGYKASSKCTDSAAKS